MKIFLKKNYLLIFFIMLLVILIFLTYKDYGIPWDEKVYFNTGKYYTVNLFKFLKIPTNLSTSGFEPTPHHLKGHGVFMDMLTVFYSLPFRNFNFETLHLVRALLAVPIFILLYWIVNKLFNRWYALLSLLFLLLFPRFYPEIYYNAVDIPTTLLFTICLTYFIFYASSEVEKQKQNSSRQARTISIFKSIIFGFILGITINQRLILLYLPIVNFIFLFFQQKRNIKQLAIQQLTIFLSTIFFLHLTHPYLLTHPLFGLVDILKSAKQYPWNAAVLFDGQFYQAGVNPLPWYYLPKSMLITTPLTALILFLVGNLRIIISQIKYTLAHHRKPHSTSQVEFGPYWLAVFYTPLLLNIILKPTLYDSWRQFLFLTVPLIIIAMYGLSWTIEGRKSKIELESRRLMIEKIHPLSSILKNPSSIFYYLSSKIKLFRFVIWIIIFINLIVTAITMIRLHPYEYLYYNSLVGGLKGAYGKHETDYWGLGYKEAVLWFNKNINDPKKQYKIFVEGDPLSSSYFFKPNMTLTTDLLTTNYLFTFTRWNFHLRHPGKTIHTVEKEGIPLIFIKKINP